MCNASRCCDGISTKACKRKAKRRCVAGSKFCDWIPHVEDDPLHGWLMFVNLGSEGFLHHNSWKLQSAATGTASTTARSSSSSGYGFGISRANLIICLPPGSTCPMTRLPGQQAPASATGSQSGSSTSSISKSSNSSSNSSDGDGHAFLITLRYVWLCSSARRRGFPSNQVPKDTSE